MKKMEMNTDPLIAVYILGPIILLMLVFLPLMVHGQAETPPIKRYVEFAPPIDYLSEPYLGLGAFYGTATADDAEEYRKEVAPLSRARYIRRIKMMFGVDITDHYDHKGHLYLTELVAVFPETQLIKVRQAACSNMDMEKGSVIIVRSSDFENIEEYGESFEDYFPTYKNHSFSDLMLYYKWVYYNDINAYTQLKAIDDKSVELWEERYGAQGQYMITEKHFTAASYDVRDTRPRDISDMLNRCLLDPAIAGDVDFINALNTIGRNRVFNNIAETQYYKLDFDVVPYVKSDLESKQTSIVAFRPVEDELHYKSMPDINDLRYDGCRIMSCLPTLNCYLRVPRYLEIMGGSVHELLREHLAELKKYDYFGNTLLRDKANWRKVDNSKIGVPHTASVAESAVLRLDPYDSGIEFDRLTPGEMFTVYEMGYDHYYLVQCAKPIEEWNKRDADGFAVCTGRMERVWGYVRKEAVQLPSAPVVTPFVDYGIVSDADGYVNLRNFEKQKIGTIPSGTWLKIISYDMNSYYVETPDGKNGYVHKSRIIW